MFNTKRAPKDDLYHCSDLTKIGVIVFFSFLERTTIVSV